MVLALQETRHAPADRVAARRSAHPDTGAPDTACACCCSCPWPDSAAPGVATATCADARRSSVQTPAPRCRCRAHRPHRADAARGKKLIHSTSSTASGLSGVTRMPSPWARSTAADSLLCPIEEAVPEIRRVHRAGNRGKPGSLSQREWPAIPAGSCCRSAPVRRRRSGAATRIPAIRSSSIRVSEAAEPVPETAGVWRPIRPADRSNPALQMGCATATGEFISMPLLKVKRALEARAPPASAQ